MSRCPLTSPLMISNSIEPSELKVINTSAYRGLAGGHRGDRRRMPVLVDSGFRRGTDIIKALALGARAVCIGRPYLWGVAGQPGVERVLEIIRAETRAAMQQVGAPAIKDLTPAMVQQA